MTKQIERLLTEAETALLTGLNRRRLQNLRSKGGGPAFLKLGGSIRYQETAILDWLKENTRTSTTGGAA